LQAVYVRQFRPLSLAKSSGQPTDGLLVFLFCRHGNHITHLLLN
jgi:hypothetical protein